MDESEWWTTSDVETMLAFVASRNAPQGAVLPQVPMSQRKLRLFLAGCCRRHWEHFEDRTCRTAVELVERLADGLADESERSKQKKQLRPPTSEQRKRHWPIQSRRTGP